MILGIPNFATEFTKHNKTVTLRGSTRRAFICLRDARSKLVPMIATGGDQSWSRRSIFPVTMSYIAPTTAMRFA